MLINLNRSFVLLLGVLLGCLAVLSTARSALGDPPAEKVAAVEEEESLEIRYARAHLDLAKLDLKRAEYWNRRIPGIISDRTLAFLKKHVEVDEEQLRQSQQDNYADVHQIYVRGAKAAVELAEAEVARTQKAFEALGGTQTALELDRAAAAAEVAKLNLERTVLQQDAMQTIGYLQWQLEELRNQILELQIKVESTPER